ncbi:MAG TPA: ATP-binding protein [Dermatophilaceae bacterium]|nr:ATP-binding protein [Dermatophilaceae bacterium]
MSAEHPWDGAGYAAASRDGGDQARPASAAPPGPLAQAGRTVRVPWQVPSVPQLRRLVVDDLRRRGLDAVLVGEAEIVVSELLTNAVRHARPLPDGTVRVHWKVKGQAMEIEVTDGGSDTAPVAAPRSLWSPSGRGLRIVRSLAHEWGVLEDKGNRTVWVALGGPSRRRTV